MVWSIHDNAEVSLSYWEFVNGRENTRELEMDATEGARQRLENARARRAVDLHKRSKVNLVGVYRNRGGLSDTSKWTRDDLISSILDMEYPI